MAVGSVAYVDEWLRSRAFWLCLLCGEREREKKNTDTLKGLTWLEIVLTDGLRLGLGDLWLWTEYAVVDERLDSKAVPSV